MENIPFRSSGSSNRGKQTPPKEVEPEPKPVVSAPVERPRSRPSPRDADDDQQSSNKKKMLIVAGAVVGVVLIALLATLLFPRGDSDTLATIDSGKYQAVTLTNGDIYFGKLHVVDEHYMKMSDIYYLKPQVDTSADDKDTQSAVSQNFNLTKFTDVPFSPEDEMTIPKAQILHFENMQPDGKVAQLISQYKKSND